ncbi:relaxin receptor 2 [Caerostris extrusa]|uniref:Relaxin receptor 2 n=1 Tax=Caerostris extrusa TaxID=172846 RepID=A0AAV4PEQ0_CAEEX|nr:relaxin receptor 2 [Caerostris extrusa]
MARRGDPEGPVRVGGRVPAARQLCPEPGALHLTTKLFKQHLAKIVYSCRAPPHAANDSSGISLTSILHHRNSKKTLVTTFSEGVLEEWPPLLFPLESDYLKDHHSSNRTSLLFPDSPTSGRHANSSHRRKDFPSYIKEDMI